MIYSVIGTGGVGGFYGSRLAHAGKDVNFLLHSDFDYVREHGLTVKSWQGDFVVGHPSVFCDASQMPRSDVVIVALKSVNNHLLEGLLPPAWPSSVRRRRVPG